MDYRGIEALYMVQKFQNFEAAAKKLFISQSAISQRIKALEDFYGEPVLIRSLPYKPTILGERLIRHHKKISLLEEELTQELGVEESRPVISIAMNRDSLETWFLDLLEEKRAAFDSIRFEIVADDQERTSEYLKNGSVSACLSSSKKEIAGAQVAFLGNMSYVLVGSPKFIKTYFSSKDPLQSFKAAPAVKFDQNDNLHERFLQKHFGMDGSEVKYNIVPSVRGFRTFALLGHGYALIPRIDIVHELKTKKLVTIYPEKTWDVPLFWHFWSIQSKRYQQFNADMIQIAREKLKTSQQ